MVGSFTQQVISGDNIQLKANEVLPRARSFDRARAERPAETSLSYDCFGKREQERTSRSQSVRGGDWD